MTQIVQKTDSLFDVLGIIGGFYEALRVLGLILVSEYSKYALNSFLALNLVRFVASRSTDSAIDNNE